MLHWPHWQSSVLWTMSRYDGLFWTFVYLRVKTCIHTKPAIFLYFIYVLRRGGFTSSIICSGCGSGSNRTVWMPRCATLINSGWVCQCNPAMTCPLGTQTGAGISQQTCRGFCSVYTGKCCSSYCAHTLRKSSCFTGRAWRGPGFARILGKKVQYFLSSAGEACFFPHF